MTTTLFPSFVSTPFLLQPLNLTKPTSRSLSFKPFILCTTSLNKPRTSSKKHSMNNSRPPSKNRRKSSYGTSRRSILKKTFNQEQVDFTAPIPDDPIVGIIGGGMSGLICALNLEKKGIKSTVFDTGIHGLGGRMGTRVIEPQHLIFDHAAQFFTVSDARFAEIVNDWREKGLVGEWQGIVGELEAGGHFVPLPSSPPRYIGVHGMRPLADSLLSEEPDAPLRCQGPIWAKFESSFVELIELDIGGASIKLCSIYLAANGAPITFLGVVLLRYLGMGFHYLLSTDWTFDPSVSLTSMVNVVRPCWISKLEPFNGMWHLSENGKHCGQFDAIVIAHNGKCANRLLASSGLPLIARQMKRLELSSIWALLAAFEDPLPVPSSTATLPFEGAFVKGVDSISWMANNSRKLLKSSDNGPHCWTFFSTAAYGKRNKVPQENIPVATAEKVKAGMLAGVEQALGLSEGSLPRPIYTRVQLWGAALPTNSPGIPCIFETHGRAGICGDWLLGSSLESAALSGIALANHIADYFQGGGAWPKEFAVGLHHEFQQLEGHDIGQFPGLDSEMQKDGIQNYQLTT